MKRFFFICVALIAFAATNASGTGYQPTTQLQTHYQADHPIVLMPALNVIDFTFDAPAVTQSKLITPAVYHNPDYGLSSSTRFLFRNYCKSNPMEIQNKDIGNLPKIKLPTQFVQLE